MEDGSLLENCRQCGWMETERTGDGQTKKRHKKLSFIHVGFALESTTYTESVLNTLFGL